VRRIAAAAARRRAWIRVLNDAPSALAHRRGDIAAVDGRDVSGGF